MQRSVERIGILGVGRMGLPIALSLAASPTVAEEMVADVTVFDLDPKRCDLAGDLGLDTAPDAAALAAMSDILITILPGPTEVESAMNAAFESLPAGACWLDLTSSDPRVVSRLATRALERDLESVEAPMGGGPPEAESGQLKFFVSGAVRAVDRVLPLLEQLAQAGGIQFLGEASGAGNSAKLLANLLWFGQAVAVTEALLLGKSLGIDLGLLQQTLSASAGGSRFIDDSLPRLLGGDYLETFGLERCVEELETVSSLASERGIPFHSSDLVLDTYRAALGEFGAVDGELLAAKLLELRAGTTLRYGT